VDGKPAVLFYPKEDVPLQYACFDCGALAMSDDGEEWSQQLGTYTFSTHEGQFTDNYKFVRYRNATDGDIQAIVRSLCNKAASKWFAAVLRNPDLNKEEKDRISTVVKAVVYP
jgi:hypothetical protein